MKAIRTWTNCGLIMSVIFLVSVGHAHTVDESNEVARTMLKVATIYNGRHGSKIGDIVMNYSLPQVFFGKIDTGEGWTYEGRQAAFDQYVNELVVSDFQDTTNNVAAFANMAVVQCHNMQYTNAIPAIRRLALNPTYPQFLKYRAIKTAIDMSVVSDESTAFVEAIITNSTEFSASDRGMASGLYAKKVYDLKVAGITESPEEINHAVSMLYTNRKNNISSAFVIDRLLASVVSGYACSSNRLDMAFFALTNPDIDGEDRLEFTAITNQLLSSGQPLQWIDMGGGSN